MFSNSHKTIAAFFQLELSEKLSVLAYELGYNVVYFNLQGIIGGNSYRDFGEIETRLIDAIPLDQFDAVIIEPDGFTIESTRDKLISRLRKEFSGPVISLRHQLEGWYCISLDNNSGISEMVDHFINEHGVTDIAFLSGTKGHNDATQRLESFRAAMRSHGLPEDGAGVYHGDFWFNCGEKALNYFLRDGNLPHGIICANDFMAISICQALYAKGYRVPDDVIVAGFDGSVDGKLYYPPVTTVAIEGERVIRKAMELIDSLLKGEEQPYNVILESENYYRGTCGCEKTNMFSELNLRNEREFEKKYNGYRLHSASIVMLEMNKADTVEQLQHTIENFCYYLGGYDRFYLVAYENSRGEMSYEKPLLSPTEKRVSVISINKRGDAPGREHFTMKEFLPPSANGNDPQIYYISDVHFDNHSFGYSAIKMSGSGCFSDFYNLFINNLSVALESLLNKNNIAELIDGLEHMSIHDQMTGMYNWRGFIRFSEKMLAAAKRHDTAVCAMTFDMDGLKYINDNFGHSCGDEAITAVSRIILDACRNDELAARLGGDEFFVFAADYDEEMLNAFIERVNRGIYRFNSSGIARPYRLSTSIGTYLAPASSGDSVENFRRESDELMYLDKKSKPNSRK